MNPKSILLLCALFIFTGVLSSQNKLLQRNTTDIPQEYLKLLQNDYRKLIKLNGDWNFSSTDQSINTQVKVPFCYDFKGSASVTREFNVELENFKNYNYVLVSDGVNYQCEISINGSFIVKHEGGFAQFSALILDGIVKKTGNRIEVKIDNTLDFSKTLPLTNNTFYPKNYGGIYRDIYILAVPKVYIKSINLNSEIDINFNADINNTVSLSATDLSTMTGITPESKFSVKTEILDTGGTVRASSGDVGFSIAPNSTIQVKNTLELNGPQLWSVDNPKLYKVRVIISHNSEIVDVYECDYGVVELTKKSNLISLNKSDLRFKGVNYIEEFPISGIAGGYDDIERDIKNIKMLGCNVIKVTGRPASPYLISVCNRLGMMIMEETGVFNVPAGLMGNENFIALGENQLKELIENHKNNPCIIAYGLGNDIDVSNENTKTFISKLSGTARSLDKRLIFYSTRNITNDICSEYVDMVGLNFYDNDLKILKELSNDSKLKKQKIFISSFGKNVNPNNFSGYSDPTSIESQSKYIVDFGKLIKTTSFLGSFFSTYADWNSDFPNIQFFNKDNQYLKTMGLFGFGREQRSSATIFKKVNLEEDIPNLNIGTFSKEAPLIFVILGLFTFVLFIYLTNSVRRFRENVWRALFRPFIFYTDVREQNLISGFYNILMAYILAVANGLFFANLLYFWKDTQLVDIIMSVIISNENMKIFTNAYLVNPLKLTALLTLIFFFKMVLISFVIKLFSLTSKFRITFNNIFTVVVWGFMPTILLLVVGTFYIRILNENSDFVVIGLGLAALLYLISMYRIFKGVYIIFDTMFLKTYAYGIATLILVYGGLWFYLNSTKYLSDYFSLIFSFLKS